MSRESHGLLDVAVVTIVVVIGLLYIADAFPRRSAAVFPWPGDRPAVLAVDGGASAQAQRD